MSRRQAIGLALALSWLNPHAWLDTAVVIGTASLAYAQPDNAVFGIGAAAGSLLWFSALGLAMWCLGRKLNSPRLWRTAHCAGRPDDVGHRPVVAGGSALNALVSHGGRAPKLRLAVMVLQNLSINAPAAASVCAAEIRRRCHWAARQSSPALPPDGRPQFLTRLPRCCARQCRSRPDTSRAAPARQNNQAARRALNAPARPPPETPSRVCEASLDRVRQSNLASSPGCCGVPWR